MARRVDAIALAVLLALIPLRAILNETHTLEVARLFRHVGSGAVDPSATFIVSGLIVLMAGLVWFGRLWAGGRRYRWTGAEAGVALLAAGAVVSTRAAGQAHLAIVGAIDLLAAAVYGLALRQVMTQRWHLRLALAAVAATGGVLAVKCGWQYLVEIPDTLAYFEAHREELLGGDAARAGRDAGLVHDFQQRMKARSVTGYYAHPNVLGSHLILLMSACAAMAWSEGRARRGATCAAAAGSLVACAAALAGTQSKGAIAAALMGAALALGCAAAGRRWGGGAALAAGWAAALAGAGLVVGALSVRPDALGRSMLFRWMYWEGASRMVADRGWLGVGANNFGRHFTRYKPAECPEEVESPHGWPVQLAAEWGALGLAGFLIMLGGATWRLSRGSGGPAAIVAGPGDEPHGTGGPLPGSAVLWTAGIGVPCFLALAMLHDRASADNVATLTQTLVLAAAAWFALMALFSAASPRTPHVCEAPLAGLPVVLGAGLAGFLMHTGIDLALFAGGPATSFFALWAVMVASCEWRGNMESDMVMASSGRGAPRGTGNGAGGAAARSRRGAATVVALGAVLALGAIVQRLAAPTREAASLLNAGRAACAPGQSPPGWREFAASPGHRAFRAAIEAYSLDATACSELLEQLIPRIAEVAQADAALEVARTLRQRDPDAGIGLIQTAAAYYQRHQFSGDLADLRAALDWARRAADDYPTSPDRHLQLATLLEMYAKAGGDDAARTEAARELRLALELEEKRVYVSAPNRMPEKVKDAIQSRIRQLSSGQP